MMRYVVRNAVRFFALLFLQYFLSLVQFLPLHISPFFYILFVLLLPFETPGWLLLLSAFLMGIGVDWHNDSMGQHALATVFIAGLRPLVLNAIAERDGYEKGTFPRLHYFGLNWALRYAAILSFAHAFVVYMAEAFSFDQMGLVLLKTVVNTLLTTALIIASQYWVFRKIS